MPTATGNSLNVTVTAKPSANALAPGTYTASYRGSVSPLINISNSVPVGTVSSLKVSWQTSSGIVTKTFTDVPYNMTPQGYYWVTGVNAPSNNTLMIITPSLMKVINGYADDGTAVIT